MASKSVLVLSGKGGVGKTAVSCFLAKYLADKRGDIFLCDIDLDGANVGDYLPSDKQLEIKPDEIELLHLDGLDVFSMSYYTDRAISMDSYAQLILDVLSYAKFEINPKNRISIFDCPAGQSETIRLVLKALPDLIGAIVVGIDSNAKDVDRILQVLEFFGVPVLGVVENMSVFKCECGRTYDFSRGRIEEVCKKHNVELVGKIPMSMEIKECLETGIPFIPEEIKPILEKLYNKIEKAKPVGQSIIERLTKKVGDAIKKKLAKAIVNSIIKINKEGKILSELTGEGFGGNVIEFCIVDKGELITSVYLKLSKGKLVVVENPKKVDISVTVEYDAIINIIKSKLGKGGYTIEDAYYMGMIEVIGVGASLRTISFIKNFYKIFENELIDTFKGLI